MNEKEMTYLERLRVSWLLVWRGALIGSVVGFVFGAIEAFAESNFGLSEEWGRAIITVGSFLIAAIFIGPLLVQMMMRKHFDGIRLQIARVPQR